MNQAMKVLRRPAVLDLLGVSTTTLYAWMAEGRFPRPIRLGPNTVAWREDEVAAWQQERIDARDGAARP